MSQLEFFRWQAVNEFGLSEDHAMVKALEDGYVTLDEYEQGWAAELVCYEELGYALGEVTTSKLNGWEHTVEFTQKPGIFDEETMNAFGACGEENTVALIIIRHESQREEDRIDPPLLADAQTCLNALDTPPNGTEVNVHELVDTTNDPPGTMNCLLDSWSKLYPGEPMWHGVDIGTEP